MEKAHIIEQIQKVAAELGEAPGLRAFEKATGIAQGDWLDKYWTKWSDAVGEAGLSAKTMQVGYDRGYVIVRFIDLMRELGRWPVQTELDMRAHQDPTFPHRRTLYRHLGRKADRVRALIEHCKRQGGYEDVIAICEPHLEGDDSQTAQLEETSDEDVARDGYVYLIKSGKYFKIGSTNRPDRRLYEIGIQLPEKVEHIHSIETDDPSGIEAYWHRRFADKRQNGEWFDLSPADIRAFKRRRRFV